MATLRNMAHVEKKQCEICTFYRCYVPNIFWMNALKYFGWMLPNKDVVARCIFSCFLLARRKSPPLLHQHGTQRRISNSKKDRTGFLQKQGVCESLTHWCKTSWKLKKNRRTFAFYKTGRLWITPMVMAFCKTWTFYLQKEGRGMLLLYMLLLPFHKTWWKHFLEKLFLAFHNIQFSAISNRFVVWWFWIQTLL